MVEIHLYGKLRRFVPSPRPDKENLLRAEIAAGETVGSLLGRLGIPTEEVYHVFLNRKLLATRNRMAPWLRYQQVREEPAGLSRELDLDVPLQPGDRLALFAPDMALLVV